MFTMHCVNFDREAISEERPAEELGSLKVHDEEVEEGIPAEK